MAGGGLFLIKRLSDYVDTKATRRYLLDTAVFLNKGDFNTPSVFLFLKKKTAALIVMSKPPLGSPYFVWAHENPTASTTFFFISVWAFRCIPLQIFGPMSILWTKKVERLCCFFEFLILLLLRCHITNCTMDSFAVIPALYIFKDCPAGFL